MKFSIQSKILTLSLSCTLIGTLTIGIFSTMFISRITQRASTEYIQNTAKAKAFDLNNFFEESEKYTQALATEVYTLIKQDSTFFSDKQKLNQYIESIKERILSNTQTLFNIKSVYVHFSPKIAGPNAGVFLVKGNEPDSPFAETSPTNITRFSPNDIEHVGWYYPPVQAGEPVWLQPYVNKNINAHLISYVIPMFIDDTEIGVTGIDIDFDLMTQQLSKARFLKTGYAYLEDKEGYIAYHPTISSGLSFKISNDLFKIAEPLYNGMSLVCIIPKAEINEQRNKLILQSIIFILILLIFTTTIAIFFARSITKPLQKLTEEAKKMITGDMNVEFNIKQKDEIGDLAKSFAAAKFHIAQHIKQMQGLAFRDSLTGVRNKMAYDNYLAELENRIEREEVSSYGIVVLDTNNLKEINDTYGHENGNAYLINSCKLICQVFSHSPIFRIGGDEFIVVLTDKDLSEYESLIAQLKKCIDLTKNASFPWKQISIAYGVAVAENAKKTTIKETFNRADEQMYKHKRASKNAKSKPLNRDAEKHNA